MVFSRLPMSDELSERGSLAHSEGKVSILSLNQILSVHTDVALNGSSFVYIFLNPRLLFFSIRFHTLF